MQEIARCQCINCAGTLEFEKQHEGETVVCPHCNEETILAESAEVLPPAMIVNPPVTITQPTAPPGAMYCTTCGTLAKPKKKVRGSFIIELALWIIAFLATAGGLLILFVIPISYTMWRAFNRKKICSGCGGESIIPPNTPRAKQMMAT